MLVCITLTVQVPDVVLHQQQQSSARDGVTPRWFACFGGGTVAEKVVKKKTKV
jgi:hypothetical protein